MQLTALRWFTISGRGHFAEVEPAQLGDQTISIGDHVLIDGAERVIVGIEYIDYRAQRIANFALLLRDPH